MIVLISVFFAVNYSFLDNFLEGVFSDYEIHEVVRIIDGDTIEIENKTSVRLLGINTPERGEKYYQEAKEFLELEVLGEEVGLEFVGDRYDKYGRLLAYVHFGNKNVNVEIVRTGFANYYFYSGKDFYSDYLEDAWDECLEAGVNLCERLENVCASCLVLSSDSLKNNCGFTCDLNGWEVKGEGRDKIIFSDVLASGEETKFDLDLSSSGGSLFLRDDDGGLVVYVGG